MRNVSRLQMLVGLIVAGSTLATEVQAIAGEDVDLIIQHGVELRRKGHDDEARIDFQRAYEMSKSPRAAAQLGFAEQAIGDWAAAEGHVQEALAAVSDPWISRNRATIEGALRTIEQHTARIDVLGGVPGADVEVNGKPAGKLPLHESVRVNAGPVNVVVRAPGYKPAVRTVTVAASERTQVHFVLEATAESATAATLTLPNVEKTGVDQSASESFSSSERQQTLRRTGVGMGIAGAVLLGAALACTLVANQKLDRLESDIAARPQRPYDESNGNWHTFQTASIVLYAAATAAVLGGGAIYYFGRTTSTSEKAVARSIFASPSPNGFVIGGGF